MPILSAPALPTSLPPSGAAGGALAGTYPNPTLAALFNTTVAGSDASSLDTGANGIAGGFNVLEIFMFIRTDEAVATSTINVTVNGDTSAIYDFMRVKGLNTTASADNTVSGVNWALAAPGASFGASSFATVTIIIPGYADTAGNKMAVCTVTAVDTTAANSRVEERALNYRSTNAITQLTAVVATGGKKFKVGSRLLIFAR